MWLTYIGYCAPSSPSSTRRNINNNEKIQKFGPHLVASKITEELREQKSNRKGWVLFCKKFQSASFMCEKKLLQPSLGIIAIWFQNCVEKGRDRKEFFAG